MVSAGRRVVLIALMLLCLSLVTVPVHAGGQSIAGPSAGMADGSTQSIVFPPQTMGSESANNSSTTKHENPARVNEDGDKAALKQWLERRLATRLEKSATNLSQGDYQQAESVLGDEYKSLFSRYVDVAGDTASEDTNTTQQFEAARERQQEYVSTLQKYRETYRQYKQAKQAGNQTKARKLARELERLQEQLNRTGTNVTATYERLANTTGANVTTAQHEINQTIANTSTQQAEVRAEVFTKTNLTIREKTTSASFRNPLQISGRLTASNGTALANRTIVVVLGPQTARTRTTANGTFRLIVRPTVAPLGNQSVTVRYRPRNTSVYLSTETTIGVTVTQVTPTVTLAEVPETVRFNETVTVAGTVSVANVTASGVPVQVSVGNTVVATTRTTANGTFTVATPLPLGAPGGNTSLRVTLPLTEQALASTTTTEALTVAPSATRLTVNRTRQSGSIVHLTGVLTTDTGVRVPAQPLVIRANGTTLTTVTTNTTGHYTVSLNTSTLAAAENADTVNVSVVYAGTGTLNGTQTAITVRLPGRESTWLPVSPRLLVLVGLLGLGMGVGLATRRYGLFDDTTPSPADGEHVATGQPSKGGDSSSGTTHTTTVDTLLERATALADDGHPDDAVLIAYEAARHHLTAQFDLSTARVASQTHWEFVETCRHTDGLSASTLDALTQLTEHYERVQFTSAPATTQTATAALELVSTVTAKPSAE